MLCLLLQDAMTAAVQEDAAAAANAKMRADQLLAEAEVAAAERLVQAAELEYSTAMQEQLRISQALGQVSSLGSQAAGVHSYSCHIAGGQSSGCPAEHHLWTG